MKDATAFWSAAVLCRFPGRSGWSQSASRRRAEAALWRAAQAGAWRTPGRGRAHRDVMANRSHSTFSIHSSVSAFIDDHSVVHDLAQKEVAQGQTPSHLGRRAYKQVQREAGFPWFVA